MTHALTVVLLAAALVGLAVVAAQTLALRRHLRAAPARPARTPPISILKPLCGLDDGLESNLRCFADLPYPAYEVVLAVPSPRSTS